MFFSRYTITILQNLLEELKLEHYDSESKSKLLDALVELKPVEMKSAASGQKKEYSDEQPDIVKGISKEDIYGWYKKLDLEEFCEENDIMFSGLKKSSLAKIIYTFLET